MSEGITTMMSDCSASDSGKKTLKAVAIIGSGGRLGGSLAMRWGGRFRLELYPKSLLDLKDLDAVVRCVEKSEASWVVNCAAMTRLEVCEREPELAFAVNARAPAVLGKVCERLGKRLVHFSTDYVFDGRKASPYSEEDAPNPLSTYAKSKLEGERNVLEADGGHFVFRVSWVFGPGRTAFPDEIIQKSLRGETLRVAFDKWSSPTSAFDVGDFLGMLIERDEQVGGLYHVCNSGGCSWVEYAEATLEIASELLLPLKTRQVYPVSLEELGFLSAPRPPYSVLSTSKVERLFGVRMRGWREALGEYLREFYGRKEEGGMS
ncbi:MAG: dTDP-4-dehydrorhamnose reductase [Chthoniobacterales bacterium]|nr:dTDP-4-dehydrorhamnose reductase [Chthoniobacterales bacterium]